MAEPKTDKLYLDHPYTTEFRARILTCQPIDKHGRCAVTLDRSYFYPESGGQTADTGKIGDFEVVDVGECEDGSVQHHIVTSVADFRQLKAEEIDCQIDWSRRFDHMQQHSGQHVLSQAFFQTAGLNTVSFHMGDDTCTIDLTGAPWSEDAISKSENLANRVVIENRPVLIRTVQAEELDGLGFRKSVPADVMEARLVEVENFDIIPCCGTHVKTTGELGVIKVLKHEKIKNTQRVYFKAGQRALDDYQSKHNIMQVLSHEMTTSFTEIPAKFEKLSAEIQRNNKEIKNLSKKLASYQQRELIQSASKYKGVRFIVHYFADCDDGYLRMLSAGLKEEDGVVAILGSSSGVVVCGASADSGVDFGPSAVETARADGGSGGGKGPFAQLKLPANSDVEKFLQKVSENVKASI